MLKEINTCFDYLKFGETSNAYYSLNKYGKIINVDNFKEAKDICNEFNPEHLQIVLNDYDDVTVSYTNLRAHET